MAEGLACALVPLFHVFLNIFGSAGRLCQHLQDCLINFFLVTTLQKKEKEMQRIVKVLYNAYHGGFNLSDEALKLLKSKHEQQEGQQKEDDYYNGFALIQRSLRCTWSLDQREVADFVPICSLL